MAIDLGKQVGPLPLGAWIAVVGGGLALAWYSYTHSGGTTIVDDTGSPSGVGDGSVSTWVPTTQPDEDPDSGDNAPIVTNEQWAVRAINWLIAQGYDAYISDSAIRKYIAGNDPKPSIKEGALQGLALQHFGSPPQPLPPATNDPDPITQPPPGTNNPPPNTNPPPTHNHPKPKPQPAPQNVRWFVVTGWPAPGSSLWSIAQKFYGNGAQYPRIFNANKTGVTRPDGSKGMISNPDLIKPGWRLYIP